MGFISDVKFKLSRKCAKNLARSQIKKHRVLGFAFSCELAPQSVETPASKLQNKACFRAHALTRTKHVFRGYALKNMLLEHML